MKKQLTFILIFILTSITVVTVSAQDLMGRVHGSWNMTKYQSKIKTQQLNGKITFKPDGVFLSEGIHFGAKEGLFTTDETRSVIIIEIDGVRSEWKASLKNDILKLRSLTDTKKPKIYMALERIAK